MNSELFQMDATGTWRPKGQPSPEDRPHGMGASDASSACNVNPWKDPWLLFMEKTGQIEQGPMNDAQRLGILLEPIVAHLYSEQTGYKLLTSPVVKHPSIPWMFCSPDRLRDDGSGHLVEIKTSRRHDGWGEPGSDEIPEPYIIQVHHQMECCERYQADVAVLIAGSDFRVYTVHRSDRLAKRIIEIEREFWRRVETLDPPTPDFSNSACQRTLKAMHGVEDMEIELPEAAWNSAWEYLHATNEIRDLEKQKERARAELLHVMETAARATMPGGITLTRKQITRKAYEVKESTYNTLTVRRISDE